MNTKIEPDAEILDALDFEPRCESTLCDHDHAATWAITVTCGHLLLFCGAAKNRATAIEPGHGMCPVCLELADVVSITPLGHGR